MTAETPAPPASPTPERPPRPRLSWLRVLVAMLVIAALAAATVATVTYVNARRAAAAAPKPWFAPYVDVVSTPQHPFENPILPPAKQVVLGFVVASGTESCTPSWGSVYDLTGAATSLDLDRRIARLRQRGGEVVVSFGGQANSELSHSCHDTARLKQAYRTVVDRYQVSTIDLDVEGAGLDDPSVDERRAAAIAAVQQARRDAGGSLAVWLTLPVTPAGLSERGIAVVSSMLAGGVDLAGVNVMTMDYGQSKPTGMGMGQAAVKALQSTHRQVSVLYQRAGLPLDAAAVWGKLGATPMIGQNDVRAEVFDLDTARELVQFATANAVRRLSMWSLNRDVPCGPNYTDVRVVSDNCSGISQEPQAFTKIFGALTGKLSDASGAVTTPDPDSSADDRPVDDPATSPYPIWRPAASYKEGSKVVWHHNVYRAKWWTQGDAPDEPVLHEWETPWTLLGPVLPGDRPYVQPTLRPGTYPDWDATAVYVKGQRVLHRGLGYEAKWWTQGDLPDADVLDPADTPWALLVDGKPAA